MADQLEFSTVLIELDAILDTRLGIIAQMGDDALRVALNTDYHNRDRDLYVDEWNNRDKSVLQYSFLTPMVSMLLEFAQKTLKLLVTTPHHYQPKIIINSYPYQLTESEATVIIATIVSLTNRLADVTIVYMNYDELTPRWVKDNVSIVVMYEYYRWLECHSSSEAFRKCTCPEIALLAPAIYFKDPVNTQHNPFEAMETIAKPIIALKLLPIEYFSIVRT